MLTREGNVNKRRKLTISVSMRGCDEVRVNDVRRNTMRSWATTTVYRRYRLCSIKHAVRLWNGSHCVVVLRLMLSIKHSCWDESLCMIFCLPSLSLSPVLCAAVAASLFSCLFLVVLFRCPAKVCAHFSKCDITQCSQCIQYCVVRSRSLLFSIICPKCLWLCRPICSIGCAIKINLSTVAVLDRGRGGLGPPSFLPGPPTIRGAIPESVVAGSAN